MGPSAETVFEDRLVRERAAGEMGKLRFKGFVIDLDTMPISQPERLGSMPPLQDRSQPEPKWQTLCQWRLPRAPV